MSLFAAAVSGGIADGGIWALAASFLGGLVSSVNPCSIATIFLMIGFTASYARGTRRAAVWGAAFALGTVLAFTGLGLVAARAGVYLGLIDRRWYLLLAALTAWMGLQTLRVLPSPNWATPSATSRGPGAWAAMLIGGLVAVILSPCATPVLIAVLGLAAARGPSEAVGLLFAYGLGRAIPFAVVGASSGYVTQLLSQRKFAKTSELASTLLGVVILALAVYFVYLAL